MEGFWVFFFHLLLSVGEFHSQSFKTTVTTSLVYRINNRSGIEGSVCKALHVTKQDRSTVYVLCLRWFPLQNPGAKTFQLKILFLLKWDEKKCTPIAGPDGTIVFYYC